MYDPDFIAQFEPYINMEPYEDDEGRLIPLKNRSLFDNAPQSAIDAFNEYKRLEAEAEQDGTVY
jgi:hypothetical protein